MSMAALIGVTRPRPAFSPRFHGQHKHERGCQLLDLLAFDLKCEGRSEFNARKLGSWWVGSCRMEGRYPRSARGVLCFVAHCGSTYAGVWFELFIKPAVRAFCIFTLRFDGQATLMAQAVSCLLL